jgi:hypothetical protein
MIAAVTREKNGIVLCQYPLLRPDSASSSTEYAGSVETTLMQTLGGAVHELGSEEVAFARFHFGCNQGALEVSLASERSHSPGETLVKWWWTCESAARAPVSLGVRYSQAQLPVVCASVVRMFHRASMPPLYAPVPFGQSNELCHEGYPYGSGYSGSGSVLCEGVPVGPQETLPTMSPAHF